MTFSSQVFVFLFAPLAIVLYWVLPKRLRLLWLIAASFAFYAYWDWRYSGLLLLTAGVDYCAALRMAAAPSRNHARAWLALSLAVNLGQLVVFKYLGFAAQTLNSITSWLEQGSPLPVLSLVLPLGLSFFTLQSLSYTIDVYRRRQEPTRSLLAYVAYVSFFPRLVAGPIARWRELGVQLAALPERLDRRELSLGLAFFAAGLVKKVLIADRLAYYINPLWLDWRHLTPAEAWAAALGYTLQLYFDFAGYSLMAIGLGYLLGISLPPNFRAPYQAASIADFWRRWHITLSFWLRDYVFQPAGGMHVVRRWGALLLTMLVCGVWHGAGWTFVIWGLYHGVLVLAHHALRERKLRWRGGWLGRLGTFVLVLLGWVVFRAPDMRAALSVLGAMLGVQHATRPSAIPNGFAPLALIALLWALLAPDAFTLLHDRRARPAAWALALLGVLAAVAVLMLGDTSPFLYNQF